MEDDKTVVSESRVPELLHELISDSLDFLQAENYEEAKVQLQHVENVIESVITQGGFVEPAAILLTLHNLAFLHFQAGNLSESANYYDGCLYNATKENIFGQTENSPASQIDQHFYLAKLYTQKAHVIGQLNNRERALRNAKSAIKHLHKINLELQKLCKKHSDKFKRPVGKKNIHAIMTFPEPKSINSPSHLSESIQNAIPILRHLDSMLINRTLKRGLRTQKIDLKSVLGVPHANNWTYTVKIPELREPQWCRPNDLKATESLSIHFTSEGICKLICHLAVAYYSISDITYNISETNMLKTKESEIWHSRAIQIAEAFLPPQWMLLDGLKITYQTNFSKRKATTPTLKRPTTRSKRPHELKLNKTRKNPNLNVSAENGAKSPYYRRANPPGLKTAKLMFRPARPDTSTPKGRQQLKPLSPKPIVLLPDTEPNTTKISQQDTLKKVLNLNMSRGYEDEDLSFCISSEDLYGNYEYESSDSDSSVHHLPQKNKSVKRIVSSTGGKN